jgi:hypothetical protein
LGFEFPQYFGRRNFSAAILGYFINGRVVESFQKKDRATAGNDILSSPFLVAIVVHNEALPTHPPLFVFQFWIVGKRSAKNMFFPKKNNYFGLFRIFRYSSTTLFAPFSYSSLHP